MGQYHNFVNLTKREFVRPHDVGDGLKLMEWSADGGMLGVMQLLLTTSAGRGGGDGWDKAKDPIVGSWAGDQVAVVGDYTEDDDLPPKFGAGSIYHRCYGTMAQRIAEERADRTHYVGYSDADNARRIEERVAGIRAEHAEWRKQRLPLYRDISPKVRAYLETKGYTFAGGGWRSRNRA